jgi:hypothetical protein
MSSRVEVSIEKLLWHLYDENGEFCRLTLNCPRFETVHFEDYSSRNTLEFDTLYIENLSAASSPFKEVLSPLVPENKVVNFKRNKMLRLHWKEIPPVAGIQVFHHFEINMFPLLIQMTFDVGKKLMYYFFPNRGQLTTQGSKELTVPSDPKLDSTLTSPDILGKNRLLRQLRNLNSVQDLKLMQTRATQNKSFIYVKVPGVNHCVSYKVCFVL